MAHRVGVYKADAPNSGNLSEMEVSQASFSLSKFGKGVQGLEGNSCGNVTKKVKLWRGREMLSLSDSR